MFASITQLEVNQVIFRVERGSVLEQAVDVIVNAANPSMRGGSGVDGAIHRAAGRGLMAELERVAPNGARIAAPVLTHAHQLPQKAILHVAGPIWEGGRSQEPELLGRCYRRCLEMTADHGWESIAFCGISTGIYGFPLDRACEIAFEQCVCFAKESETSIKEIRFAMFHQSEFDVYTRRLALFAP